MAAKKRSRQKFQIIFSNEKKINIQKVLFEEYGKRDSIQVIHAW